MSYGEYRFGDFRKYYEGGPSDELVGFAQGFAEGFVPAYQNAVAARRKQEDDLFKLAIEDIQEREKAKADKAKKTTGHANKAASLAKMFPNLPGVEAYIYQGLSGGMSANQIVSDLQAGIKDNRVRVTPPSGESYNPLEPTTEDAPTELPKDDQSSSLEAQTDEALGVASNEVESSGDYLTARVSTMGDGEFSLDGSYQEASTGVGWIDRWHERRRNLINDNVNKRVDAWKKATGRSTDVTSPSGLTATKAKSSVASVSDVKDGSGTTMEVVGSVLSIIPKVDDDDKKSALDLKPVNEIDSVEDAIVAKSVAESQPDNPESSEVIAIADKLLTDLTNVPELGNLAITDLDVLATTPQDQMGPAYRGVDPTLYSKLQDKARELARLKRSEKLPSLNFETSAAGQGILADYEAGKLDGVGRDYLTQLRNRISALETAERVKDISGEDFTMDDYDNLDAQMVIKLTGDGELAAWRASEGKLLKDIAQRNQNRVDAANVPNDPKQLAIYTLRNSEAFKNMSAQEQIKEIRDIEALFNPQQYKLSRTDLAGMLSARQEIVDNPELYTPDQVAVAQKWIDDIFPSKKASIEATDKPDPVEIKESVVTILNQNGEEERVFGKKQEDGSVVVSSSGIIIPSARVMSVRSLEAQDMINKEIARLPSEVGAALTAMQDASKFAVQAKRLDDVVRKNEEVLQLGGRLQAGFGTFKVQTASILKAINDMAQSDDLKGATPEAAQGAITRQINGMIDSLNTNDEVKSAYKAFVSQSILLVFSAGATVGQTGNGFSNKDFAVLQQALTGATTYAEFTNQLRNFAQLGLDSAAANLAMQKISPRVANTASIPGTQGALAALNYDAKQYLEKVWGESAKGVYDWSQSREQPSQTTQQPQFDLGDLSEITSGKVEQYRATGASYERIKLLLEGQGYPSAYLEQVLAPLKSQEE